MCRYGSEGVQLLKCPGVKLIVVRIISVGYSCYKNVYRYHMLSFTFDFHSCFIIDALVEYQLHNL